MRTTALRTTQSALFFVFVLVAMVASAAVAVARPASPDTRAETHCVIEVVDQRADGELVMSDKTCFDTFAKAQFHATGGKLVLAPDAHGSVAFKAGFDKRSTQTLGIHYNKKNGGGSSITVVGSGCTGGYWNTSSNWDNKISSSYNGCPRLRHYDKANLNGMFADTTGVGTTDNLPSFMNNKTESVQYRAS